MTKSQFALICLPRRVGQCCPILQYRRRSAFCEAYLWQHLLVEIEQLRLFHVRIAQEK
jgi:hypothetical protein